MRRNSFFFEPGTRHPTHYCVIGRTRTALCLQYRNVVFYECGKQGMAVTNGAVPATASTQGDYISGFGRY